MPFFDLRTMRVASRPDGRPSAGGARHRNPGRPGACHIRRRQGRIADSHRDVNNEVKILTARPDGTGERAIPLFGHVVQPAFSPNAAGWHSRTWPVDGSGRTLLAPRRCNVVRHRGRDRQELRLHVRPQDLPAQPRWLQRARVDARQQSDGTRVVLQNDAVGLYVVDIDGSNLHPIGISRWRAGCVAAPSSFRIVSRSSACSVGGATLTLPAGNAGRQRAACAARWRSAASHRQLHDRGTAVALSQSDPNAADNTSTVAVEVAPFVSG